MYFTIPNLLGVFRILAGPLVAYLLMDEAYGPAFWVFLLGGLSDAIDGPIARAMGLANKTGLYLDPVADKFFINTLYIALWFWGFLPLWIAALVFFRDFLIASTIVFEKLKKRPILVQPTRLSKTNTGLQIALVALILGHLAFPTLPLEGVSPVVMYIMAATTFLSGAQYFLRWAGIYPKK